MRKQLWRSRGVLLAAPIVAGLVIGARSLGLLQSRELAALDWFFQLRPLEPIDERVVVIEINETDIQKAGKWPMSDAMLAKLLTSLKQQQPRVIGLDLYRDLPIEPGHADLVNVFKTTPNLIGIQKVAEAKIGGAVNPPPTLKKLGQVGANDLLPDVDGRIRRSLLSLKDQAGKTILGIGAQAAVLYLQAEDIELKTLDPVTSKVQLGKAAYTPLQTNDGGYVGVDAGGYQILSNFHNLRQGYRTVSMTDVLEGRMPKDFVRDRVVFIGVNAESAGDFFQTPYSRGLSVSQGGVTGVYIHADTASQLISSAIEGRSQINMWSDPAEHIWIFAWAVIGSVVCWLRRYRKISHHESGNLAQKVPITAIAILVLGAALVGGSYLAFLQGWWIPVVPALFSLVGSAGAITAYTAYSAAEMRQTFGRYLTDEVVANLLETPEGLKLGGERRTVTMLISDLRGFSAISEQLSPETAMSVVNLYLEAMIAVINQYQGTINDFMGDGIFVFFGAPIQRDDDAERAVACAIAMQLAMEAVNQQLTQKALPVLEMGIGIHTGEVLVGNVGSQQRAKYTVIGSNVNLAARIETYTVGGQILAAESTVTIIGQSLQVGGQLQMRAKGFRDLIYLHEVYGIGEPFNLALPRAEINLVALQQAVSVQCRTVQGKALTEEIFAATLVKLSAKSAELHTTYPLEPLTNLTLSILIETDGDSELWDVYAKVTEVIEEAIAPDIAQPANRFIIRFTSVPAIVAQFFERLQKS